MDFVGKILEKTLENKFGQSSSGYSDSPSQPPPSGYGYDSNPGYGAPPPPQDLPYPWIARWDARDQRYYFVNEQTGQTSWEHPGYGAAPASGYRDGYEGQGQGERSDHSGWKMAGGALAGVAVGAAGTALVMHEGEEIREDWDRAEDRVEEFPEDAARWTGEKVGEVEQIPENIEQDWDRAEDRIENGWDNAVDDVENAPENAAEWVGEQVGEVEQFGDRMENAYDQGEAEGRSDW
ncbi:hypothetical protein BJX96DRAFT_170630 [Aspergillus floccosus]